MAFLGPLVTPKMVEVVARFGQVHAVWLDQEHCTRSPEQLDTLLLACRAENIPALVRVPPTDYVQMMHPLESGAVGVMVPQVRSVEQVHQVVSWCKYPPEGSRGLFLGNTEANYGATDAQAHIERANREHLVAIQIETAEAVEQVDDIAGVQGVDALFVGPGDLACCLGVTGQPMHERCLAALQRVSDACRQAGKPWGVLPRSSEHMQWCYDHGCRWFSTVGDLDALKMGLAAARERFPLLYGADDDA